MKKFISICQTLVIAFGIFQVQQVSAQDYEITFAGTGASSTVSTVEVENLTTGATLTLNGNDILHLGPNGISLPEYAKSSDIKIYPNPMMDNSIIELSPPEAGDAVITVYEMTGKALTQFQTYLDNYRQEFRMSGLQKGIYLVSVSGTGYRFSGKILCNSQNGGTLEIEKVSHGSESAEDKILKKNLNESLATIDMEYATGERLKYKATAGIFSTVKTDVPNRNKKLTFNFVPCTDVENNNYSIVEIGKHTWMAENLKSTKYNNGIAIPLIKESDDWENLSTPGYCYYNNDSLAYNAKYGPLYNWYTVNTGNLCPYGWHVPNESEFLNLESSLGGRGVAGGKLKETGLGHWNKPNQFATNEYGFTALPGGGRDTAGTFWEVGIIGYFWGSSEPVLGSAELRYIANEGNSFEKILYDERGGTSVRCIMDVLPTLKTINVTDISTSTANSGGEITLEGTYPVTARGVCWSTEQNPTIENSITTDGDGIGNFVSGLTGLTLNTRYYVRAYATSQAGTAYGKEIMFTVKGDTGSVSDIEGNTYSTIEIGSQIWMSENLKTTKYNDGTEITLVEDSAAWISFYQPAFCWYNNDSAANSPIYGALYNFYAVNTGKLCPTGWKVPSDNDWKTLEMYLGMTQEQADASGLRGTDQGARLKSTGLWHDTTNNTNGSGFTGLPAGSRYMTGDFHHQGEWTFWWSSTSIFGDGAVTRFLDYSNSMVHRYSDFSWYHGKTNGFSVRCLKE